ncbi:MAG: serine hydrolase domain-containing protein [Nitrospira sp.]|nr:class A beta-lactamase-related serine hydrolase [Candidatus Manganitrophaceae bacterium]HIL35413.1 class A beta-lactamase-related serine hydrolase [Candidatus Manganitrophaceae bacterium]
MKPFAATTEKMKEGLSTKVFPGGVLLIHHRGKVVYHKAFGHASLLPEKKPMKRNTLFDLASLTKPLATSAILLLMIQEEGISLKDPLTRFIPGFTRGPKREITLSHLLTHSSGLPDWKPYFQTIARRAKKESGFLGSSEAKAAVYTLARKEPLISAPGEVSRYSDIGFMLLGEIIEKVGEASLHRICSRRLFSKIPCRETFFINQGRRPVAARNRDFAATEDSARRKRVVCGIVHDDNTYAMGGVSGHAGLFSTAKEVYQLVRLWLDGLRGEGIFNAALAKNFVTCQRGKMIPARSSRGLGWDTPSRPSSSGRHFSKSSFGHLGFTGTSIWVDPTTDLAVILLTNRVHPDTANEQIRAFRPVLHNIIYREVIHA